MTRTDIPERMHFALNRSTTKEHLGELIANSVTHGIGALLSIAGTAVLITLACMRGNGWHITSCAVFGASLVVLYVFSTLYHALPGKRLRYIFRIFDHSSIYLLIAGTYTPFMLVNLRGPWGWSLFGATWGMAACGIVFKSLWVERLPVLSTSVYVVMGWLVLIGIKPLLAAVPWTGLAWLLAGGCSYTLGVFFFASRRIPYSHAIWHLFVLAGSIFHYCAVLLYVIPRSPQIS